MWVVYIKDAMVYVRNTLFETWMVKQGGHWGYCERPSMISKMSKPSRNSRKYDEIIKDYKNNRFN